MPLEHSDPAEYVGIVHAAEVQENHDDSQSKAEVSEPVYNKSLFAGIGCAFLLKVVTYKEIGAQPNCLPAEIELKEIIAQHKHKHRKSKEAQVGKETVIPLVTMHVADGVNMYEQAH